MREKKTTNIILIRIVWNFFLRILFVFVFGGNKVRILFVLISKPHVKKLIIFKNHTSINKDDFINSIVRVKGVIEEVCPMRGCWLQVGDENNNNKKIRFKV